MDAEPTNSELDRDGWELLPSGDGNGVPSSALELGKESLPREVRVAAARRDGAGAVWFDAADGPRAIDRSDPVPARQLFEKARDYEATYPPDPASITNGGGPADTNNGAGDSVTPS